MALYFYLEAEFYALQLILPVELHFEILCCGVVAGAISNSSGPRIDLSHGISLLS